MSKNRIVFRLLCALSGGAALAGLLLHGSRGQVLALWLCLFGLLGLVILLVQRNRALVQESHLFARRLQSEVELRSAQLAALADERQALLSESLHDLKSPMAAVLVYAQALQRSMTPQDQEPVECLSLIQEKCAAIAENLRELQEFTAENPLAFYPADLDLEEMLETFFRRNQPDVEVSSVDLRLKSNGAPCIIRGDRKQLERALENLLYNAVGFTPEGGVITLSLLRKNRYALLQVSDTGQGIPEAHLSKLFTRGFTTRGAEGGRGLGLYIVRTIVTKHGGAVTVQSQPDKGTVFTLALPLKPSGESVSGAL